MEWNTLEELREEIRRTRGKIETPQGLYNKIKKDLNYKLDYAEERVKQLKEVIDEDLYVDCLSSQQFTEQQIKKKESNLSDCAGSYTHHLDRLADYILYTRYDNEEQEEKNEALKSEIRALGNNKSPKVQRKVQKSKEQVVKPYNGRNFRESRSNIRELRLDKTDGEGNNEGDLIQDIKFPAVFYTWNDKELNQKGKFINNRRYWRHYSQKNNKTLPYLFEELNTSQCYSDFAYETIASMDREIHQVEKRIKKMTPAAPSTLQTKKNLSVLRSNYNITLETLRNPVILKSNIYSTGDGYEIAQKANYSDILTVRAMLYNYSELHAYHQRRTGTTIWTLLFDLERAIDFIKENHLCSDIQLEIVDYIMNTSDFRYEDLRKELLNIFHLDLKKTNLTYHINIILRRISEYLTKN